VINARGGCLSLVGLHKPSLCFPSPSLSPSRTPPPPHDHTKTRSTSAGDGGPARRRVQQSLRLPRPGLQSSLPLRSTELNLTVWRIESTTPGLDSAVRNSIRRRPTNPGGVRGRVGEGGHGGRTIRDEPRVCWRRAGRPQGSPAVRGGCPGARRCPVVVASAVLQGSAVGEAPGRSHVGGGGGRTSTGGEARLQWR
jgi:hypothetical protein